MARRPRPASRAHTARRSAPTRSRAPARSSAGAMRRFQIPADVLTQWRAAGQRSKAARASWDKRLAALPPTSAVSSSAACAAIFRRAQRRGPRGQGKPLQGAKGDRDPHGLRVRAGKSHSGGAGNDRRLGRPHRLQQHAYQVDEGDVGVRLFRPLHPLRHSRARHGRSDERHDAASRHHPYSGTFLVFSDYCRPSIRLAALMGERVIHIMTHDSIGLGEDGPTHQPSSTLAALRAIPNLNVFRPCDAVETLECWQLAGGARAPSVLALTGRPCAASPDAGRAQQMRRRRL